MKQKEASIIFGIFAIFLLSISFASAGWLSDFFNKNRIVTGDAACGVSCPKETSSTPSTLPSLNSQPQCAGTNNLSCPDGILGRVFCTSFSPYKTYCKLVNNQCIQRSCSEIPVSSCNLVRGGCMITMPTSVKVNIPIYGSSQTVAVLVPVAQANLKYIWCGNTQVGSKGWLCGGSKCGTVDYRTGVMSGPCQSAIIIQ
jgi:hypothetical protein